MSHNTLLSNQQFFNTSIHIGAHYILRFTQERTPMFFDNPIGLQIEHLGSSKKKHKVFLLDWHWLDSTQQEIQPPPFLKRIIILAEEMVDELTKSGLIDYHLCTSNLIIPGLKPIPL